MDFSNNPETIQMASLSLNVDNKHPKSPSKGPPMNSLLNWFKPKTPVKSVSKINLEDKIKVEDTSSVIDLCETTSPILTAAPSGSESVCSLDISTEKNIQTEVEKNIQPEVKNNIEILVKKNITVEIKKKIKIDVENIASEIKVKEIVSSKPAKKRPKESKVKVELKNQISMDQFMEVYEVQVLLAKRGKGRKTEYLVKWKGYSEEDCTWEPYKHLDCKEMIEAFEETVKGLKFKPSKPDNPVLDMIPRKKIKSEEGEDIVFLPKNISVFLELVSVDSGPTISIVNTVDDSGPPEDFIYISRNRLGAGVPPANLSFVAGCNCSKGCTTKGKGCSCHSMSEGGAPYDCHGLLQLPPHYAIYECNSLCKCPSTCINRVIQRGRSVKLQIFKTPQKGWGVRALEMIPKGSFVAEYVGEIITDEEAEKRGLEYDSQGLTYLFDLDYSLGPQEDCLYSIDASKYGNVTHFFNHSCAPNCAVYPVFYENFDPALHNLSLFAIKDIQKMEEICFDYSAGAEIPDDDFPTESTQLPEGDSKDLNSISTESATSNSTSNNNMSRQERLQKYRCYCGAPKCRKYVHIY